MIGNRTLFVGTLVLAMLASSSWSLAQESSDDGFRSILPNESFDGWVVVNTAPSTWKIEDGMLICSGKPIGEIRTERMYQNFVLEVEWRHMVPGGNAGIFLWADDITAKGQPFHRGIEVQVLDHGYGQGAGHTTHGDIFPIHGATMNPINGRGGSRAFPTEERANPSPEWNHYRIECVDGRVTLAVNGKVVTEGRECSPSKGYLCLESEGGVVHYRKLRIKELPDSPVEARDVAIADRGYRSLYDGIGLDGWQTEGTGANWSSGDWVLAYRESDSGETGALTTTESFEDHGFLFDVRWTPKSRQIVFEPRGAKGGVALELAGDAALPAAFNQDGWNRIEGRIEAGKLFATLNGEPWLEGIEVPNKVSQGPWRLRAAGEVDLANLYMRRLDGKRESSD